jgi:8-oxo-dGTP pyrophosphatase MutT (NUDIX family)
MQCKIYKLSIIYSSMEKAKQEKSAGAVVFYLNKYNLPIFLLLQNTLKKTYWEFPKGKIEQNENIEETVKREVTEETGLKNFSLVPGFSSILTWFFKLKGQLIRKEAVYLLIETSEGESNTARISNEHQKLEWMTIETARNKINIRANRDLIEKAYLFIQEYKKQRKLF